MHINDLDDNSLLHIFQELSTLADILVAGRVCKRWRFIRRAATGSQRTLSLKYVRDNGYGKDTKKMGLCDCHWNYAFTEAELAATLVISSTARDYQHQLAELFPNVTNLLVEIYTTSEAMDEVIALLEQPSVRPNVTTLRIFTDYDPSSTGSIYSAFSHNKNSAVAKKCAKIHRRLLSVVNSMSSLTRLSFDVNAPLVQSKYANRINMPILSKLSEFYFASNDSSEILFDSLKRFTVDNNQLNSIRLSDLLYSSSVTKLLTFSPQLADRFAELFIELTETNHSDFIEICHRFTNLHILSIGLNLGSINLRTLLRPLHGLNIDKFELHLSPETYDSLFEVDDEFNRRIQLPTVTQFMMVFTDQHPDEATCKYLPWDLTRRLRRDYLPSLRKVTVRDQWDTKQGDTVVILDDKGQFVNCHCAGCKQGIEAMEVIVIEDSDSNDD